MNTVLITGASSGIGLELAHVYAENGYNLFLTARREDNLMELKKTIEEKHNVIVNYFPLDLSVPGSSEILYAKTKILILDFEIVFIMRKPGDIHCWPLARVAMHLEMRSTNTTLPKMGGQHDRIR